MYILVNMSRPGEGGSSEMDSKDCPGVSILVNKNRIAVNLV